MSLAAAFAAASSAEEFSDDEAMYDYIDDDLDVSYELLEFTASDDGETEDVTVYAGDVVIAMFTHDEEFDVDWDGDSGLELVVSYVPDDSGSEVEMALGVQVPDDAEPEDVFGFELIVETDDGDEYEVAVDIEVLKFSRMRFYLTLILVFAVMGVILYFLVF